MKTHSLIAIPWFIGLIWLGSMPAAADTGADLFFDVDHADQRLSFLNDAKPAPIAQFEELAEVSLQHDEIFPVK